METEIFTCKYFKFGRNTTGLSQSHLRNFLACSIITVTVLAGSHLNCQLQNAEYIFALEFQSLLKLERKSQLWMHCMMSLKARNIAHGKTRSMNPFFSSTWSCVSISEEAISLKRDCISTS